jgi:hypothetical protein
LLCAAVPQESTTGSTTEGVKVDDSSAFTSEEAEICGSSSSPEVCSTSTGTGTVRHEDNRKAATESNLEEGDRGSSVSSCGSQRSLRGVTAPPRFVPLGTQSCHTEER